MSFANTGVHDFNLSAADGEQHSYLVTAHPAGEGMGIMYELLALGTPAMMTLAGAAMKSRAILAAVFGAFGGKFDGDAPVKVEDIADLQRMLVDIDLAAVGQEIGRSLATGKAPDLTKRILSRVLRDGKPLNIDLAYKANYAEMLVAVWKVCEINRFFPLPSISPNGSKERTTETAQ